MDAKLAKYPDSTFIYALFLINAVIFLVMLYADQSFKKYADPRLAITMYKHFMCSMQNLQEGRWWTLLTSSLAHRDPMHILFNMVTLGFMAPPVLALTGPSTFLALYFGGSLVSNVVSLLAKTLLHDGQHARVPSMGASGSIYALMTTFACVHPHATFLIFFVLPAPAWAVVGGIFAYDAFRSFAEPGIRTDTAGHVGGILTGLLFWRFGLRGIRI
ncbi:rhomboid-domain-containing protein [Testicularia cyperi]|uniref:Rhomboid-domain-containing protein n=1 Tax=Testicularia cyperi TaxID=1882483 RepID=A0A317XIE8_9BASI|nr:rhomboid-domain-containing protein [Testicularia cyperi]PWY97587.1 rhomboid-domain-containing protein [Testicularia cyperi]